MPAASGAAVQLRKALVAVVLSAQRVCMEGEVNWRRSMREAEEVRVGGWNSSVATGGMGDVSD